MELKDGDEFNPHIIYLLAINSEKPIEEMFYEFRENVTDNLDPEGLDMLVLFNRNSEVKLNPLYLNNFNKSKFN